MTGDNETNTGEINPGSSTPGNAGESKSGSAVAEKNYAIERMLKDTNDPPIYKYIKVHEETPKPDGAQPSGSSATGNGAGSSAA